MKRIVDMGDYNAVIQNRDIIARAMALDFADPNFMPVSRDLSPAKRNAILAWLKNPVPGNPPPVPTTPAGQPAPTARGSELPPGGKAAAFANTIFRQRG